MRRRGCLCVLSLIYSDREDQVAKYPIFSPGACQRQRPRRGSFAAARQRPVSHCGKRELGTASIQQAGVVQRKWHASPSSRVMSQRIRRDCPPHVTLPHLSFFLHFYRHIFLKPSFLSTFWWFPRWSQKYIVSLFRIITLRKIFVLFR